MTDLCMVCRSMCSTRSGLAQLCSNEGHEHHGTLGQVSKSANQGCPFCRMLLAEEYVDRSNWPPDPPSVFDQDFKGLIPLWASRRIKLRCATDKQGRMTWMTLFIHQEDFGEDPEGLEWEVLQRMNVYAEEGRRYMYDCLIPAELHKCNIERPDAVLVHGLDACVVDHPPIVDLKSKEAYEITRKWLSDCDEHQSCPRQGTTPLPTRVLSLSRRDTHRDPRIFISKHHESKYSALSYCWGGKQYTTTSDNFHIHTQGLPESLLSQTVQDAIDITRQLGLQYLWVDALCILQDDEKDKDIEISKMRDYYSNATVTIVAGSAESATEGFLSQRRSPPPHCQLPFLSPSDEIGIIFVSHDVRHHEWPVHGPKGDSGRGRLHPAIRPQKDPIISRGWTLQENLLSPRLLQYTNNGLVWKCQETELYGGPRPALNFSSPFWAARVGGTPSKAQVLGAEDELTPDKLFNSWWVIVRNYTLRRLTVPEDKLPAISAIAQEFQRVKNDTYLAGLWRSSMMRDLMWWCAPDPELLGGCSSIPPHYRTPSWSWASRDGTVGNCCTNGALEINQSGSLADIESASVVLKNEAVPFGEVVGGTLEVRGMLKQVSPYRVTDDPGERFPHDKAFTFERCCGLDTPLDLKLLDAWFLPLYATHEWDGSIDFEYCIGLMLTPVTAKSCFRRIGYFTLVPPSWFKGVQKQLITII